MKYLIPFLFISLLSCSVSKMNNSKGIYPIVFTSYVSGVSKLCLYDNNDSLIYSKRIRVFKKENKIVFDGRKLKPGEYYLSIDNFLNQKIIKL